MGPSAAYAPARNANSFMTPTTLRLEVRASRYSLIAAVSASMNARRTGYHSNSRGSPVRKRSITVAAGAIGQRGSNVVSLTTTPPGASRTAPSRTSRPAAMLTHRQGGGRAAGSVPELPGPRTTSIPKSDPPPARIDFEPKAHELCDGARPCRCLTSVPDNSHCRYPRAPAISLAVHHYRS